MTNYSKFSKKQNDDVQNEVENDELIIEPVVEPIAEQVAEPVVEPAHGFVVDCEQLYVRSEPSTDSEPLGIIKKSTNLLIYENESTDDFYKICTEAGLEGFCMNKFIAIR